jgi:hypothetical protein
MVATGIFGRIEFGRVRIDGVDSRLVHEDPYVGGGYQ